jgi:hypothetical protein
MKYADNIFAMCDKKKFANAKFFCETKIKSEVKMHKFKFLIF